MLLRNQTRAAFTRVSFAALSTFLTLSLLHIGCGKDPESTAPTFLPSTAFSLADSSDTLVTVREGVASGHILMMVGETATFHVGAAIDGRMLRGIKVVDVRPDFQNAAEIAVIADAASFTIDATRPISMGLVVTSEVPGMGLAEFEFEFYAMIPRPVAGVRIDAGLGGRYQQLGTDVSGQLIIADGETVEASVSLLDSLGAPLQLPGRYTRLELSTAGAAEGIEIERIANRRDSFRISVQDLGDVRLVVRAERGESLAYASRPIEVNEEGWHRFESSQMPNGTITDLIAWHGALVASGDFDRAGGTAARGIASWDGVSWSALGEGHADILELVDAGEHLLAVIPTNIFAWDGQRWAPVELPPEGVLENRRLRRVLWSGNRLYVQNDAGLWRRESTEAWELVTASMTGPFAVQGETLWLVRAVRRPGDRWGLGDQIIDRWDGATWVETARYHKGDDYSDDVSSMRTVGDRLYHTVSSCQFGWCGDSFWEWSGFAWIQKHDMPIAYIVDTGTLNDGVVLASAVKVNVEAEGGVIGTVRGRIHAMAVHERRIYVAGRFDRMDDMPVEGFVFYLPKDY